MMVRKTTRKGKKLLAAQSKWTDRKGDEFVPFARKPLVCCLAALLGGAPLAHAAPLGGQVTGGQGSIAYGNTTTIQQSTSSLAIDWQSFNVNANESVQFVQPSSSAVALNRILDQNPSQIFGSINANGRVFLSNPNGLIFGEGASINAGSFVASGLDINTADFMAGNYNFGTPGTDGGAVINRGLIEASSGGSVSLIGSSVLNEGVIIANYGEVNLGAGQTAVLDFDGDGLIRFEVDGAVLNNALGVSSAVDNQGEILANGGEVLLTASAAQDVFTRVVNNDGVIEAGRIDNTGGVVRLIGIGQGEVISSGTIDALGQDAVSTGGTVHLLGEKVGLFDTATVDASGPAGGGTVLIGGDREGANPDIRNATATYVGADTAVHADALVNGDGGKVIVYADETAGIYGNITARGGSEAGNGGFIETSGKQFLDIGSIPDVGAAMGNGGEWLIDPYDLTITSAAGTLDAATPFTSSATANTLGVDAIATALGSGSVTIQTGDDANSTQLGDITWNADAFLNFTSDSGSTLTLDAHHDIFLNGVITFSSSSGANVLTLLMNAGNDITIGGSAQVLGVTSAYGIGKVALTLNADSDSNLQGAIDTGGTINTNGGDITLNASGAITQSAGTITAATLTATADNNAAITLNQATNNVDSIDLSSTSGGSTGAGAITYVDSDTFDVIGIDTTGTVSLTATNGAITQSGAISANSLTTTSSSGTILSGANTVDSFSATNTASGNIVLNNDSGTGTLTLGNISQSGGGDIIITEADAISSQGSVSAGTGNVTLEATSGALTQTAGSISGSILGLTAGGAITQTAGTISGTNTTTLTAGGAITQTAGTISGTNTTTLTAGNAITQNGGTLSGTTLTLIAGGAITQNGGTVSGTTLSARADGNAQINLSQATNAFSNISLYSYNGGSPGGSGTITYRDIDGFTINALGTTGSISLTGGGDILQSASLSGGSLTVKTIDAGAIALSNTLNDFDTIDLRTVDASGAASIRNITYVDSDGFDIAGIQSKGTISLTGEAAITQSGAITGEGALAVTTKLNAGADITLTNESNSVASIELRSRNDANSGTAEGTIQYTDSGAFTINGIETRYQSTSGEGDVILIAGGAIDQTANIIAKNLTVTTKFTAAGGAAITLDHASNDIQGNLILRSKDEAGTSTGTGNLTYRDATGFTISALETEGDITLIAGAAINSTVALSGRTLTVDTIGSNYGITLNDPVNNFDAINLSNHLTYGGSLSGGGNISYSDTDGFTIDKIDTTGNVTLSGGGVIDQTGAIYAANLTATTTVAAIDDGASITLDNAYNNITGNLALYSKDNGGVSVGTGNLTYRDTNGFTISALSTEGDITLTAGAAINPGVPLSGSTLTVETVGGYDITLGDPANSFDTVILRTLETDGSVASRSISYQDTDGFSVGGIQTGGNVTLTGKGVIDQVGATAGIVANNLTVKTLDDNGAGISLDNQFNDVAKIDFSVRNGADSQNRSANVFFTDIDDFSIQQIINGAGNVTLTAGGNISQINAITGTTLNVTLLSGSADQTNPKINLTNSGNDFDNIELRSLTADGNSTGYGNITYLDTDGFNINGIETKGDVTLTGAGNLILSASSTILADDLSVTTSGSSNITLDNAGNDVATINLNTGSGEITYQDNTGFTIIDADTSGNITLTAGGAIDQATGQNITAGTLTVTAKNNGTITLEQSNNVDVIALYSKAADGTSTGTGNITYKDTNGFNIDGIETSGNVVLTAGNDVVQNTGSAILGNTLTVTAGNDGDITLNEAGNNVSSVNLQEAQVKVTQTINGITYTSWRDGQGDITYQDADGFTVNAIKTDIASGYVELTAGGNIDQAAGSTITGNTLTVTTTNNADISLVESGNNARNVALYSKAADGTSTGTGNISYQDTNGFTLNAIETSGDTATTGNVVLTAGGQVIQAAGSTVEGNILTVTAGNNGLITLAEADNDFNTVSLQSQNGTGVGSGTITYNDLDGFTVDKITTTNTVGLTAGFTIDQAVGGSILGSALTVTAADNANITLAESGNNVNSIKAYSIAANGIDIGSGNITYYDADSLIVSEIETSGTVSITTGGTLTATNTTGILGTPSLILDAGGDLILGNSTGQLTFSTLSTTSTGKTTLAGDFSMSGDTLSFVAQSFDTTNLKSLSKTAGSTAEVSATFGVTSSQDIFIGKTGTAGLVLNDTLLDNMDILNLTLQTNGSIFVDTVVKPDIFDQGQISDKGLELVLQAGDPTDTTATSASMIEFSGTNQFRSLSAEATNGIEVNGSIKTTFGEIYLDGDSNNTFDDPLKGAANNIVFQNSASTSLESAGSLTLAAETGDGLIIDTYTEFTTSGNIDLGNIRVTSSDGTTTQGSLSLITADGNIILGDIGIRKSGDLKRLSELTAQTSGTVYINGDLYATNIDLSNAGWIVLKQDVKMVSNSGTILLGQASAPAMLYSVTNPDGPFGLEIDAGLGNVELGPIGQTLPATAPIASLPANEAWAPLSSLKVTSGPTALNGNVKTSEFIDFSKVGSLGFSLDVSLASPEISLGEVSDLDNSITLTGINGEVTSLSLFGDVSAATGINLANVGNIELYNDVALASTDGSVYLSGIIDGNLDGVGPKSFSVNAATGGVVLAGEVEITASNVNFGSTPINGQSGAGALVITTVDSTGKVSLFNVGGTDAVKWLSVNNAGELTLSGTIIKTNSAQGINLTDVASVNLASDVVFNTTSSNGSVNLSSATVSGSHSVDILSGSGNVDLGNFDGVSYLTVTSSGNTTFWDSTVTTTSPTGVVLTAAKQVYIEGDVLISATGDGAILLDTTVDGSGGLTINTGTAGVALGTVGEKIPLAYLIINGQGLSTFSGNINTTGDIDLQGAGNVNLTTDSTFISSNGNINLTGGSIDGTDANGSYQLALVASNGDIYLADVGTTTDSRLASLNASTSGTIYLSADIGTNGANGIDFSQAANVYLQSDVLLDTADGNGQVLLNGGAVDGSKSLSVNAGTGSVTLGNMGMTEALSSLNVTTGGELLLNGNVATSSDINLTGGSITMSSSSLVQTDSGNVSYTATTGNVLLGEISATTGNVTINSNSGDIFNNRKSTDASIILVNVTSENLTLNALDQIGASSTDPITIDVPSSITLGFGADTAYVRNLRGTAITVTRGEYVMDVLQSSRVAANQSTANGQSNNDDEEDDDDDEKEEKETDIITWLDNTRSPDVPRMIHTKKGWLFTRANEIVLPEVEVKPKKQKKESSSWTRDMFKF